MMMCGGRPIGTFSPEDVSDVNFHGTPTLLFRGRRKDGLQHHAKSVGTRPRPTRLFSYGQCLPHGPPWAK